MEHSDEELPKLLAVNLAGSFVQLVQRFQRRLYTFALRQTRNPEEAEDIVQEAFLQAYISLENYSEQRILTLKLSAWLYKITLHVFYNRQRRGRLLEEPLDLSEESPLLEQEIGWQEQPEAIVENAERLRELEMVMSTLPERYQVAVNCYYFAEMSYQEIASLLNQPVGTVKSHVFRGLHLLRQALGA